MEVQYALLGILEKAPSYALDAVFINMVGNSLGVALKSLYFVMLGGSVVLTYLIIRMILPMLDKITRPEANRTE